MHDLMQDIRYALRALVRSPGFTLVAVVTLALGIGANTAIFSVLYGVLLRPLPYPQSERLTGLVQQNDGGSWEMSVTYRQFRFLQEQGAAAAAIAASTPVGLNLFSGTQAERITALRVSANYFPVLGVAPALGRGLSADEDIPAGPNVVVLSDGLWRRRFAADPAVLGRSVQLDGTPYTVVGVMPAGFRSEPVADAWSTLAQVARTIGSGQNLTVVGRLAGGLSLTQAQARLGPVVGAFKEEFAGLLPPDVHITVAPLRALVAGDVRQSVQILFGAIGFVLLIACANVASLLLGRSAERGREVAVRVALGATQGRLLRQLLTEHLLLALLGGTAGLLVAGWGLGALLRFAPDGLPRLGDVHLDGWTLAFTAAAALTTGLLFGVVPAWHTARASVHDALKDGARGSSGRAGRMRSLLIVGEVALSLVLLAGAGLLIRTFVNLRSTEPGFDPQGVVAAEIWLTGTRYQTSSDIAAFYDDVARRLTALPGVASASVVEAGLPLERGGNMPFKVDGEVVRASIEYRTVTPSYFANLAIPLLQGRLLTAADREGAPLAVVVNDAFVHRHLGDGSPLGRLVSIGGNPDVPRTVVGVVGDVRSFIGRPGQPAVYLPSAQTPPGFTRVFSSWFPTHVLVRASGATAALAAALPRIIHDADPMVPVGRVRTMTDVLGESLASQRFVMLLLGLFAGLAIVLAAVGIYGLIAYVIAQRTHEIGIRMALGARPGAMQRMVLGGGLRLAGAGTVIGLAVAWGTTRVLASQLHGVPPTDPLTFGAVTVVLGVVAGVACWIPARRAARVDPIVALRSE